MGLDRINDLRKQKGMTIEELAEKSRVPIGTLKKICAGITTNPNLDTVIAIAQALECKIDELASDEVTEIAAAAHFDPATLTPEGRIQYENFIQYLAKEYTHK